MVNFPEMITMREAADRSGISFDAIRKMVIRGEITHIKVGKKYLINAEKMVEYLNKGAE